MKGTWRFILAALTGIVAVVMVSCGGSGGTTNGMVPIINGGGAGYTVSGTITANGVGLSGVDVTVSGSSGTAKVTTDSSGKYLINNVNNGSYVLSPTLAGYSFTPADQSITVSSANLTVNAITATPALPAKVFVIAKSTGTVLRINANTLEIEKTITLGVSSVSSIAVVGDMLWYSWSGPFGNLGRYNLTTDVNEPQVISNTFNGLLRTSPAQPGVLYLGDQDVSPANILKIDISVNPPVVLAQTAHGPMGSNLGDFKVSADGTKIWSASGSPYNIVEIRTSDMVLSGTTFPTGAYPTAVDHTTVNGIEVLVGGTDSTYDKDVHVFQASDPSITDSYETGIWSQRGNVAISKNATKVYSVHTKDYNGSSGELVTVFRPSGLVVRKTITTGTTFNSGIGVDYLSGRVFVATLDSVSVFDTSGNLVGTIPSVAGASTVLVVAP